MHGFLQICVTLRGSTHEILAYDGTGERHRAIAGVLPGCVGIGRDQAPRKHQVELTYNWDPEVYAGGRNFGHLAYAVDDIYATCQRLMDHGVTINRPPRDGHMAFVRSPDNISVELLQKDGSLPPQEPWASMPNTGVW
jgi:lactoylglutathione lyase